MNITKTANHYFYSTYFLNEISNLTSFAQFLLESEFCKSLYHSDDTFYMKKYDHIEIHEIEISQNQHYPRGEFSIPEGLTGYNDLYLHQALNSKVYKNYLFNDSLSSDVKYIKCFLDKFIATDDIYNYHFYPVLTIFSTGIIILDIQLFSPENINEISESDYLNNYVNLYRHKFTKIKVPVTLSLLATLENMPLTQLSDDFYDNKIEDFTEENQRFINIDLNHFYKGFDDFSLTFIKDYIFNHIELTSNTWSPKKLNSLGNYWTGKPIVMLNEHNLNEKDKNNIIDFTLARMKYDNKKSEFIKKDNLRHTNDYDLYMTECISLFINNDIDPDNLDGVMTSILVIEEEAIHLFLLAKQENEHVDETSNLKDIFMHKRFINYLKKKLLRKNSSSGEINHIIKLLLYEHYKIQVEEELLDKKIEEKQSELLYLTEKNRNSFYNILSIFFGIIGSSSIYEFVIAPLFVSSKTTNILKVKYYLISLVGLLFVTFSVKFLLTFKDKYR